LSFNKEANNLDLKDSQIRLENIKKTTLNIIIAARKLSVIFSQIKLPPTPLKEKIRLAKENLNEIYLTEYQRWIVNEIAEELAAIVPFNDFALRGFLLRSIKKWQLRYDQPIILVSYMSRYEQISVGLEILGYLRDQLNRAIFIPDKKLKKKFLDEIYRRIFELYEELISVCTFLNNPTNQEYIIDFEIENWIKGNHSLV